MKTFWSAAAAMVLFCAGMAQATTVKFTSFSATTSANPRVSGVARMTYDSCADTTHASVELHNLDHDSNYVVYVASDGPGTLAQVTTSHGGNASVSVTFAQDATVQNPPRTPSFSLPFLSRTNKRIALWHGRLGHRKAVWHSDHQHQDAKQIF